MTKLVMLTKTKASRSINVNPYHVFAFIGNVKLSPDTDIWQDTERLPDVSINREGNFDAVLAENANALGTVWNSWQTTWVGEPTTTSSEVHKQPLTVHGVETHYKVDNGLLVYKLLERLQTHPKSKQGLV